MADKKKNDVVLGHVLISLDNAISELVDFDHPMQEVLFNLIQSVQYYIEHYMIKEMQEIPTPNFKQAYLELENMYEKEKLHRKRD